MNIAYLSSRVNICPQCGENRQSGFEFCPRCGSPAVRQSYDPLQSTHFFGTGIHVNRHAKWVVRLGIFGIGSVSLLTGILLFYGGWVSPDNMDVVQIWISRFGGPILLAQGLVYGWLPFRKPAAAKVIAFPVGVKSGIRR